MATIPDISFSNTWVDINTVSGIAVGEPFLIQNKRSTWAIIQESNTAPDDSSQDGIPLTNMGESTSKCYISQGSGRIWIKSFTGATGVINVNDGLAIQTDNYTDSPEGLYTGLRAITTQGYPEANVKNGLQFYIRASWPLADAIPNGQTRNLYFKTSTKKMLAKVRIVHYIAEEIELNILSGATVTPATGTPMVVGNYNNVAPMATTVTVRKDVTFTGGVSLDSEPEYYFGSSNNPQRSGNSIPEGRERVLPLDTEFIVTIKNTGSGNARVAYFLDWYEGEPDLPLP